MALGRPEWPAEKVCGVHTRDTAYISAHMMHYKCLTARTDHRVRPLAMERKGCTGNCRPLYAGKRPSQQVFPGSMGVDATHLFVRCAGDGPCVLEARLGIDTRQTPVIRANRALWYRPARRWEHPALLCTARAEKVSG